MSKKLKILLFVSIIINVLLVGVVIGHFSTRYFVKKHFKDHFPKIERELPAEKQKMLTDAMMKLHKESRVTKRKIHKLRKEIAQVVSASEFDEQLFNEKVSELHDLHGEMARSLAEVTKNLAVKFTPEERRMLAEILKKRPHRRQHDRLDRPSRHRHPDEQQRPHRPPPDSDYGPHDF